MRPPLSLLLPRLPIGLVLHTLHSFVALLRMRCPQLPLKSGNSVTQCLVQQMQTSRCSRDAGRSPSGAQQAGCSTHCSDPNTNTLHQPAVLSAK